MSWDNVSHILETLTRNGADKEVRDVLVALPGQTQPLKDLEKKAAEVYGRSQHIRQDLEGDNWQMAHVAKNAAKRLKNMLDSGGGSSRSFKAIRGQLS